MEYKNIQVTFPVKTLKSMDACAEDMCMNRSEFIRHMFRVYETEMIANRPPRPGIEYLESLNDEEREQLRAQLGINNK